MKQKKLKIKVQRPGSRGGKFWLDDKGSIRYGPIPKKCLLSWTWKDRLFQEWIHEEIIAGRIPKIKKPQDKEKYKRWWKKTVFADEARRKQLKLFKALGESILKTVRGKSGFALLPSKKDPKKRRWQKVSQDQKSDTTIKISGMDFDFKRHNGQWIVHHRGIYIDRFPGELSGEDKRRLIKKKALKWVKRARKTKLNKSMTWSGHKLQGRTKFQGLDISVENKAGTYRSGTGPDGKKWRTKLHYTYGYIRGTKGVDKDHVDCFIGPDKNSTKVFIIHQHKIDKVRTWPKGKCPKCGKKPTQCFHDYDEDKVMLGWTNKKKAIVAYLKNYDTDKMLGPVTEMDIESFKKKALSQKNHAKRLNKAIREALNSHVRAHQRQLKTGKTTVKTRIRQMLKSCTCQECESQYKVDILIPDELWERIKPTGKSQGAGLLCGDCIIEKLEKIGYSAWTLNTMVKGKPGSVKPGHKYIKREGTPGKYKYTYPSEVTGEFHISRELDEPASPELFSERKPDDPKQKIVKTKDISISNIVPDPDQPRTHFDEKKLKELGQSIKKVGLIQSIAVRPDPVQPGKYIIIVGERRWRASKIVGLSSVRARIYDLSNAKEIYAIQVAENVGREQMNPIETANAFRKLYDVGVSIKDIANKVGAASVTVERKMMLTTLIDGLKERIAKGDISETQGIIIAMGDLRPAYQRNIMLRLNAGKISNEALSGLVGKYKAAQVQTTFFEAPAEATVESKVHKNKVRALEIEVRQLLDDMGSLVSSIMSKEGDKIIPAIAKEKGQLAVTLRKLKLMTDKLNKITRELERAKEFFRAGGTIPSYLESRGIKKKQDRGKRLKTSGGYKIGDKIRVPTMPPSVKTIVSLTTRSYALRDKNGKIHRFKGPFPFKKRKRKVSKAVEKSISDFKALEGFVAPY